MTVPLALALGLAAGPQQAGQPARPVAVRMLELTHDGLLDKVYVAHDGELSVAVNRGGGFFEPVEQSLPRVAAAHLLVSDLDGDGFDDLYVVGPGANAALLGDGHGGLREATAELGLEDAGPGVSAERVDLDGEEPLDLLLHNATGDARLLGASGWTVRA